MPGCAASAVSRSAGWIFNPAAGDNHIPLAPAGIAGRPPHSSPPGRPWPATRPRARASCPPCQVAPESISPRTSTSPSSAIFTSRPGSGRPTVPARDVERMVQRHQRGRLGHAIALDQRKAQPVPESLQLCRQRRAARDDRPELPAQRTVHPPEHPPAPQIDSPADASNLRRERGEARQQMRPQQLQHARHGNQHRDALAPDQLGRCAKVQAARRSGPRRPAAPGTTAP